MVTTGIHGTEPNDQRILAVFPVAVDITQVIDVKHGGGEQTTGGCRKD